MRAAREAGVDRRTAKKAWEAGLPYSWGKTPIRQIVQAEQTAARARLEQSGPAVIPAETAGLAQADAAKSREAEARMVRAARGNAIRLLEISSSMLRGGVEMAKKLEARLPALGDEDIELASRILRDVAALTRTTAVVAAVVIKMENMVLGPNKRSADVSVDAMTPEEAVRELELAADPVALAQARERWGQAGVHH